MTDTNTALTSEDAPKPKGGRRSPTRTSTSVVTPGTRKTATPARRRSRKYDWATVRETFVEGLDVGGSRSFISLRQVAEHHDIPYQRVKERSAQERWVEARTQHQLVTAKAREKERAIRLAGQAVEFDEQSHKAAVMGQTLIMGRLAEIAKEVADSRERIARAKARLEQGLPVERHELWSAINYREMESLARALQTFQQIGQRALGTDAQQIDLNVESTQQVTVDIVAEMRRDDPDRLAALVAAVHGTLGLTEDEEEDIVVGEVIEEGQSE